MNLFVGVDFKFMHPVVLALLAITAPAFAGQATGDAGFDTKIAPLFDKYCISCHSPEKKKGDIVLSTLDGHLSTGKDILHWERIFKKLKKGEMPPEDDDQPSAEERQKAIAWIDAGFRKLVDTAGPTATAPTARRLTNFEYQNTLRDLIGFELKVIKDLPEDPVKPYKFNNTAELMLMGMEQLERYQEVARRVMASAIVDPGTPKIHKSEKKWQIFKTDKEMGSNELGVYGGSANAMGVKGWPNTGEFRVRVKASAKLPTGISELPLRLVMGYNLNENSSMLQMEPIGTAYLRNNVDQPQIYEFRGRIENHPIRPGTTGKNGVMGSPTLTITMQNLYDDGTLNDNNNFQKTRNVTFPRAVIDSLEFEAPIADVWPPDHHTRILFDSPLRKSDPTAYVREVLNRFMSRAFRRPATADELDHFAKIHAVMAADVGTFEQAIRETLAMVLISPQFMYHTVAENGRATHQYELASKLSYFLLGTMPDDTLLKLAEQGKLDDARVIESQVRRLLADKRSADFVDNFTTQWLSIAKMKAVKINTNLFPRFIYLVPLGERAGTEEPYRPTIRDFMHDETVGFIAELIKRNASVLNIVDSDFAFLNQPLAAHYGVEDVMGNELRPVAIKPEHRLGGLLTQGSVLVGNSTGSAPHPIYRAVWLREAILGDEVKPPPADVPALSDTAGDAAEKAVTIKDLLRVHRKKESCNDCHAKLDPWGIPFEQYNAIGKFQPMVPKAGVRVRAFNAKTDKDLAGYENYLKSINTIKVQADSPVPHGPKIDGVQELKAFLLKERKDDIAENVLRRLLTYGLGRELTFRDRYEVERLLQQSKKIDYKFQDMIIAICQSEVFRGAQPKGK